MKTKVSKSSRGPLAPAKKPAVPKQEHAFRPLPKQGNQTFLDTLMKMKREVLAGAERKPVSESLLASFEIGDEADQAGHESTRQLSILLSARDKEKIFAIDEALEKMKQGTYGLCEECGEGIGPGRLRVMPLARFCITCQSGLEKEMTLQKRTEEELKYKQMASDLEEEETL